MQRKPTIVLIAATMIALSTTSTGRADFVQWRYNWTPSTLKVVCDTSPTRFVTLGEPIRPDGGLFGLGILRRAESDIQMTGIKVPSDAPRGDPNIFRGSSGPLGLGLLRLSPRRKPGER